MESSDPVIQITKTTTNRNIPIKIKDIKPGDKPQSDKEKIHVSTFFVLFNTNVSCKDAEENNGLTDKLKKAIIECILNDQQHVFKIVNGAREDYGPETIKKITLEVVGEIGDRFGRCHAHAVITVKHTTLLQIDQPAFRNCVLNRLADPRVKNLFVRTKFIPISDFAKLYLRKKPV